VEIEHSSSSGASSSNFLDDTWHTLTYTRSASGAFSFYIDNVLDVTGTHNMTPAATTAWYLGGAGCGDDPFNGDMAYMVVYDTELTPLELDYNHAFLQAELAQRGITLP